MCTQISRMLDDILLSFLNALLYSKKTKALLTNDTHWTSYVIITLTSHRCQYFAKKTHILPSLKEKRVEISKKIKLL